MSKKRVRQNEEILPHPIEYKLLNKITLIKEAYLLCVGDYFCFIPFSQSSLHPHEAASVSKALWRGGKNSSIGKEIFSKRLHGSSTVDTNFEAPPIRKRRFNPLGEAISLFFQPIGKKILPKPLSTATAIFVFATIVTPIVCVCVCVHIFLTFSAQ
jgi:hypothetical protein